MRACACGRAFRRALSIRAARLFRARPRFQARKTNLESHDHVAGYLGKGSEEIIRGSSCVAETTKDLPLGDQSHKAASAIFRLCERSIASLRDDSELEGGKRAI